MVGVGVARQDNHTSGRPSGASAAPTPPDTPRLAGGGVRTRQVIAANGSQPAGDKASLRPSPPESSKSPSALRDAERTYVPADQAKGMAISPAEARRRGLSAAAVVAVAPHRSAKPDGQQVQDAAARADLGIVGSEGIRAKQAVWKLAKTLSAAKSFRAEASDRATMTLSQTRKAMDEIMSSLDSQDLSEFAAGQSSSGVSADSSLKPAISGNKHEDRKNTVLHKTKAPTPAEKQKAEEAAVQEKHELGVRQTAAVTKMSTHLVARRRALSQVEAQTSWIAKAVFAAASRRQGPLALNLLGCNVNNSAAIRLATTLATSDIKILNLTFNHIGDVGTKAIARALTATPALTELGLGSNLITDHGAAFLATALEDEHSCLTFLNLSGNMIGDRGAASLGEMLQVNPSLVEICLDSNFIGVKGKDALTAGMYNNASQSLEFVSLAGNVRSGLLYKLHESLVTRIVWKP